MSQYKTCPRCRKNMVDGVTQKTGTTFWFCTCGCCTGLPLEEFDLPENQTERLRKEWDKANCW